MAELATIARPYAEALIAAGADAAVVAQVAAAAAAAADPALQQFAANPKATAEQVFDVLSAVAGRLQPQAANLLRTVIDNGRLNALPLIAEQAQALLNARSGVSQGVVFSAYPIDAAQVADVKAALESRFGRRLDLQVQLDASLIGGIRAVVGDEVLDTSVKARLEKMKAALTA